jgi:hypothetical protein
MMVVVKSYVEYYVHFLFRVLITQNQMKNQNLSLAKYANTTEMRLKTAPITPKPTNNAYRSAKVSKTISWGSSRLIIEGNGLAGGVIGRIGVGV